MKARIKFSKNGSMRFIGHLDVMRFFQRAFRCAHIPVSYSKGFSPHQILSFTSPLGIGLTSDAEYMDMELEECPEPEKMIDWMNTKMNGEIQVLDFRLLPDDAKPSMAMLAACDYVIALKPQTESIFRDKEWTQEKLETFWQREQIIVQKKTKRSEKEVNIRPNLYHASTRKEAFEKMTGQNYQHLHIDLKEFQPVVFVQMTAGSVVNIKPELFMQAFCDESGVSFDPLQFQMHRLEMYGDANGKKGEVHLPGDEVPCRLVPLSKYP